MKIVLKQLIVSSAIFFLVLFVLFAGVNFVNAGDCPAASHSTAGGRLCSDIGLNTNACICSGTCGKCTACDDWSDGHVTCTKDNSSCTSGCCTNSCLNPDTVACGASLDNGCKTGCGTKFCAQPICSTSDWCRFNAQVYSDYYGLSTTAFNTLALATYHWKTYGVQDIASERKTPCGAAMPSCHFDYITYLSINTDVANAGLTSPAQALGHYLNYGIAENRAVCPICPTTCTYISNYTTWGGCSNGVSYPISGPITTTLNQLTCPSNVTYRSCLTPVCGSAANVSSATMPSSNLCSAGTLHPSSGLTADGTNRWYWGCVGYNTNWAGDTAWCFAPKTPPGVCGTANNDIYEPLATAFTDTNWCTLGTPTPSAPAFPSAGNSVSWTCVNGGVSSPTCIVTRKPAIPGGCITAPPIAYSNLNRCDANSLLDNIADVLGPNGIYLWNCKSQTGGTTATCSIPMTCHDGIKNQDPSETGIDIGGICETHPDHPGSGNCSDGIQNGDETGIDIGNGCAEKMIIRDCSIKMTNPPFSPVNVNTLTTWQATSTAEDITGRTTIWTIVDANGTTTATTTKSTILSNNHSTFTTTGLKRISAKIASSTTSIIYKDCTAPVLIIGGLPAPINGSIYNSAVGTTTMVQTGGNAREI